MIILIHDRKEKINESIIKNSGSETMIISDDKNIKPCVCCFGCWIKTPGICVINDGYENLGALLSKCNKLIIISECFYGGYSPFIKNVLDRCICPYQLPYFVVKNGRTSHPKRYKNKIFLSVNFYGNISEKEEETAGKLVKTTFLKQTVNYFSSFDEIKEV